MKTLADQQMNRKSIISILTLLLLVCTVCRSASGADTISDIQGKHVKNPAHAAYKLHAVHQIATPRRIAEARHIRYTASPHKLIAHGILQTRRKASVSQLASSPPATKTADKQSLDPAKANKNALDLLRYGNWRDGFSVFPSQQILFQEDYGHSDTLAKQWSWSENAGKVNCQNDSLELTAKGHSFPVIQTLNDPFPSTGDWTVSIGYRFTSVTVCGTDLKIARLDGSGLPNLALLHEDNNGQFLNVDGVGQVWHLPANTDWHILTMVKQNNQIQTIMDGKAVAVVTSSIAPVGFRFGDTRTVGWDADWTSQQIRFVEVTAPRVAERGNLNAKPPTEAILFSDNFQDPARSTQNWTVNQNGGSVRFQRGAMCLKDDPPDLDRDLQNKGKYYDQSGFPVVKLRQNPFPAEGNWALQFSLDYNKTGPPNPDGIAILRADGSPLLGFAQDDNGRHAFLNGKELWRIGLSGPTNKVILAKQGNQVILTIDGKIVGTDVLGKPPTTIELGGGLKHDSRKWNNFDLYSISVAPD